MNNQKILEIKQLKKSFAGLDQPVLDNINLNIDNNNQNSDNAKIKKLIKFIH